MTFVKTHWFGLLIGFWLLAFVIMLVLIIISPKYDLKNRGFTYCTQCLVDDLQDCDRAFGCSIKAVTRSTWCDIKIIAEGLSLWYNGKQPAPWSNYIFTPEINTAFDDTNDKDMAKYLEENPDTVAHMQELIKLRKDWDNAKEKDELDFKKIVPESPTPGVGLE